jgi:hypothetical protein
VRWGEISVAETTRVEIVPREKTEKKDYAHALSLGFVVRSRTEEFENLLSGERTVDVEVAPYGTLLIAAEFENGTSGWDNFKKRLLDMAGQLSPVGYAQFLSTFEARVEGIASEATGSFSLIYCVSNEGQDERAGEISCKKSRDQIGQSVWNSGSSQFNKPHPVCSTLQTALRYLSSTEVLMTDLQVEDAVEENLTLAVTDRSTRDPGPWPTSARFRRTPPPENSTAYSSGSSENGVSHYEELRGATTGEHASENQQYLLVADAAPATLSKQLAEGRSIVTRWSLAITSHHMGVQPRTHAEDAGAVILALFPSSTTTTIPSLDQYRETVALALDKLSGLLTPNSIRTALIDANPAPGADEIMTVICLEKPGDMAEATYCLARACSPVLNPKEFCSALSGVMSD